MPVRITQMMKFTNFVNNMNFSMDKLMDLNEQASSQKKVNRPSQAPVAAGQILQYRSSLASIDQYTRNADIAKGWLSMADSTLVQVNTVLTRVRELAEQAATGTMSQENREQVGYEVRQLFEQLIVLSNTEYEEQHIFAGHKTSDQAFDEGMGLTQNTEDGNPGFDYTINGLSDKSILVQFVDDGGGGLDYRFSRDGGRNWTTKAYNPGDTLDLDGVQVETGPGFNPTAVDTQRMDESINDDGTPNGTWLWVRPTAIYNGDTGDNIEVDVFSPSAGMNASAEGFFPQDVMVRIDKIDGNEAHYSYSLDRGVTWKEDNTVADPAAPPSELLVPGGYLTVSNAGLSVGDQFNIRPERAEIDYEISPNERLAVNNIGKDVFGGIFFANQSDANAGQYTTALDASPENMFETVGKLVGYIETNNQSGIQQGLANLAEASEHVLTAAANVGARENRLDVAVTTLESLHLNKSERLSEIEDADVSELMTQLAQQQIVYESVLKSSSMIMRMSLLNYV